MNSALATFGKITRLIVVGIWAAVIITAVAFYLSHPAEFTAANIAGFIHKFERQILLIYLAMSAFRGFTLLPSTPLVLAGTILYPSEPWLVLGIAMIGILISSSLIYFCSDALGFARYFENKKRSAVAHIRRRLEHPFGLVFVALWAFFRLFRPMPFATSPGQQGSIFLGLSQRFSPANSSSVPSTYLPEAHFWLASPEYH